MRPHSSSRHCSPSLLRIFVSSLSTLSPRLAPPPIRPRFRVRTIPALVVFFYLVWNSMVFYFYSLLINSISPSINQSIRYSINCPPLFLWSGYDSTGLDFSQSITQSYSWSIIRFLYFIVHAYLSHHITLLSPCFDILYLNRFLFFLQF